MIVEIAHPNDAYEGQWTVGDEGDVKDILVHPSFEVYEGLMARADSGLWIFHRHQWVDISAKSDVGRHLYIYDKMNRLLQPMNAIDRWRRCPNGAWLLWSMQHDLLDKKLLNQAAFRCAALSLEYTSETYQYHQYAEEFLRGERDPTDMVKLVKTCNTNSVVKYATDAYHYLFETFRCGDVWRNAFARDTAIVISFVAGSMAVEDGFTQYEDQRYQHAKKIMEDRTAQIVREVIPFHAAIKVLLDRKEHWTAYPASPW